MKKIGFVLITVGIALLIFIIYNIITESNKLKSPIPENNGVKVIFITPSP